MPSALPWRAALACAWGQSGAGHSVGHYPSYYPDEIRIEAVDPAAAGKGLIDETLHAYVGAVPNFAGPVPGHVKSAKSLGSFLVLSFNTASARFASARGSLRSRSRHPGGARRGEGRRLRFHPLSRDALSRRLPAPPGPDRGGQGGCRWRAFAGDGREGRRQGQAGREAIVAARLGAVATGADAVLEVVTVDDLLAAAGVQFHGWSGPPWVKEGWFQAHRLLASGLDAASRLAADGYYDRLMRGEIRGLAERTDLERHLVAALTNGCERLVVGYALKEEFFNEAYPAGVENIAYDSMSGLNSPIFIRTVKLKDYPWNGKLHLGVRDRSDAAWNPVGGFTDVMGRLIWSAVGDPAMIAFPDQRELDAQPRAIRSHQGGRPVRRRQSASRCDAPGAGKRACCSASVTGPSAPRRWSMTCLPRPSRMAPRWPWRTCSIPMLSPIAGERGRVMAATPTSRGWRRLMPRCRSAWSRSRSCAWTRQPMPSPRA